MCIYNIYVYIILYIYVYTQCHHNSNLQYTISVFNSGVKWFALVFLKRDWQDAFTVKI